MTIDIYCRTVKLSVIGVEFRDKLLGNNVLPPLLSHSSQPIPGQAYQRLAASATYTEICKSVEHLNAERAATIKLLHREYENPNMLKRKCLELQEINETREDEVLGSAVIEKGNESVDSLHTDSDEDSVTS